MKEEADAAIAAADPGPQGFGDLPAGCHTHIWVKQLFDVLLILFGKPLGAGWGLSWMLDVRTDDDCNPVPDNPDRGGGDGGADATDGGSGAGTSGAHSGRTGNGGVAETVSPRPLPATSDAIGLMAMGAG